MPPHEPERGGGDPNEPAVNTTVVACPTPHSNPRHLPHAGVVFPVILKFEEVVYKVKVGRHSSKGPGLCCCCGRGGGGGGGGPAEKMILNGITGVVCPGEILAMLGPSGSGKTTLLTAFGGRRLSGKLSGKITYNGLPFSGPMKRRTGFVAQDDVLYPHLTVAETLAFTALLRLPRSLDRAEKVRQAHQVMSELGLARVAHTMIGGPLVRGVSGGERRRVSIGQEMLINPSLLLLDEPTSGLDSTTAARIVTTLKRLATEGGRTVVTTIHQPSSRLYHMFDKVVVLSAEGSPIYYGRAAAALEYFVSIGFSSPLTLNPADLLLDLANGIAPPDSQQAIEGGEALGSMEREPKAVREELISAYDRNIATRLKAELYSVDPTNYGYTRDAATAAKREQWCTSWCEQFRVLLRRGLRERRFEAFNKLRIFQVLSVATLGGLLWWHTPPSHIQDKTALLFFFSVFWGFFPLYNAVFTFPQERPILIKERSSGMYHLSSYFLARTAGDLPMELALPIAFVLIIYWMGGLKPHPASFILSLLIVLFSVLVSQSLGLAMGALLMNVKQATTLASVTTLVFLIAGGYYVQQIPPFIVWLKYLSYSFYCYKLLIGVQFSEEDYYECSPGVLCPVVEFPAIKSVGLNHMWVDVCIMALMLLGYRLVAYLALHRLQHG
ncbi:ABC transporter G family member 14-like [Phoenix dactylifera]|uniref:ABC transporter G family member 14-like n=1 Tax=Phoenix dactylifera TaxID=42345 RepID=A0A8B7CSY5_PHODC|nr:ABC transporter G family member 14-like [Phoenix dactylifera]